MTPAGLIPSLQSDALAREIEQQLKDETQTVLAAAQHDARATIAQARRNVRVRMHETVQQLRREGARRLARATAQSETEARVRAQHHAAAAVRAAMPLLHEALMERWRDPQQRKLWTDSSAQLAARRLQRSAWLVEHAAGWSEPEQRDFVRSVGAGDGVDISFKPDRDLTAGLRITADQAVLDATPGALVGDSRAIAALLLDEIGSD